MDWSQDVLARLVACVAVVAAVAAVRLPRLRRLEPWAYGLAAAAGVAAFFNFGSFHHHFDRGFVNRWELFHYQLGARYFPELGFDGLYAASLVAQAETHPRLATGDSIRDLRTNQLTTPVKHLRHAKEVKGRFAPERWRSFVADHRVYADHTPVAFWRGIREDHGFNASPAWTFVARLFCAPLPPGYASLALLAVLDVALLLGAFLLVFRTFGWRIGCLAVAVCGLRYGWPYLYLGAFLRLDWLAAVLVGLCLLRRERFGLAGACFAYATLVRVFPVVFLAGPGLLAAKGLLSGRLPGWSVRLGAGFAVALVVGLAAGALAGRGPDAWSEFAARMQVYRGSWGANLVGLDTLVLTGPGFVRASLEAPQPNLANVEELRAERRIPRTLLAAALLALAAAAMWRATPVGAAVLGVVCVFALTAPVTYYWIMLAVVPLRGGVAAPLAVLLLAAGLDAMELAYPGIAHVQLLSALTAWGLLAFFVAWTLPARGRLLRAGGRAPRA